MTSTTHPEPHTATSTGRGPGGPAATEPGADGTDRPVADPPDDSRAEPHTDTSADATDTSADAADTAPPDTGTSPTRRTRRRRVRSVLRGDDGMSTVEYAIGTVAAAAFAAILYAVVSGDSIVGALTGLVQRALAPTF